MKKFNLKLAVLFTILLIVNISSCRMAIQALLGKKNNDEKNSSIQLDLLTWNKNSMELKIGGMDNILLTAKPENKRNEATIVYEYNSDIINLVVDSRGAIVEGLKKGKTVLSARNGNLITSCIINVSGYDENYEKEPYIYSTNNIIQLRPGTQERVAVSLYGGSAEDSQKFKWKNEKNEVIEIAPNGQFCLINAKGEGNSKITITHPKAPYPYTMRVYNLPDTQNATYINNTESVITLQKNNGDKEISVVMENPPDNFNPSLFKWELIKKEGEDVCSIDFNREKCVVTPLNSGTALIKVSHPSTAYPLEILVRVVELVKNVYIKPSETFVEILGSENKTISLKLEGTSENYDVNAFQWSIPDNEVITYNHYGNEILISGKKNGMVKITVSHPMAAYPRDIMINVKNQTSDAIDTSHYITTSQDYIRTKVGAEAIPLNILLVGGETGDQKDFKWTVKHNPKVANAKVIKFETTHGEVFTRSAISSYEDGSGYITPLSEGTAVIEITHPKIIYPTEVLVKVLPSYAVLEAPLYFTGVPIVRLLNNSEQEISVNLQGKNKTEADNDNIKWETESTHISLTGNGEKALIRATGQGSNISHITVSHPRADSDKKIIVLTADTQEELDKMKVLYAYKQSYKMKVDDTLIVQSEHTGFTDEEIANFTWTSLTPDLVRCEPYIDKEGKTFYALTKVTGLKSGEAHILLKSNLPDVPNLAFDIMVLPKNANIEAEPDEAYLTTFQNVVSLKAKNESANVEVTAVGLSSDKLQEISWLPETNGIVSVNAQGNSAVFTALKEGETKVIVSHPECQNKLKIHVRVGKAYIFNNNDKTIYISTDIDTILAVKDEPAKKITARLVNYSDVTSERFKFTIDKSEIADLSQNDNSCLVKPVKAGQALITVSHPKSKITKSVLVVVGNSKEELEGFSYLTTVNKVITVTKGQSKNISVTVMNNPDIIIDGYSWESKNPEVATAQGVGANAVIHGNEVGTARIKVSNTKCTYPLELIVICVDSSAAVLNPFISTATDIVTLKAQEGSSPWTTFTVTLEGGSKFDQQNFSWQVEDSNIVQMFGQGSSCKMRAIKAGTTRLIINHPKAEDPCYVLLISDAEKPNKYFIDVPEKIITMKPNQSEMAITASLINGDIEDKYAFNFYADTYDIIELNYSANVASIRPIGQGQTTIHVTHPKAAYEQQIIVKVSEYTQFEFGMEYYKLTKGKTGYVNMRVPVTSVPCHVEYESLKTDICMIEGTNKTAQITAIGAGNTKVKAKLVATKTNIVQATAEMLINVEESAEDLVYITTSKTVYSIEKGTTTTIASSIAGEGIGTVDQQSLKWKSSDPSVIRLIGASTTGISTGPQCMLQALKSGECTVTISHEKCNTDLIIKIIVPGTDDVDISLNKTYIRLETGGRTEVKAKLTNAKPEDYKTIEWLIQEQNGNVIADVLGKGETVAVFARNVGKTVLQARLPNGKAAECEIVVEASRQISFTSQEVTIEPGETKTVKYSVSPEDAGIQWITDSDAYFDYSVDEHTKTVRITGKKEGFGRLTGVTQYGNRTTLSVKCTWNYKFSIDKSIIKDEPKGQFVINYDVVPQDAKIEVVLLNNNTDFIKWTVDEFQKKITLTPIKEGSGNLSIIAKNPRDQNKLIGTRTCNLELLYKEINILPKITKQKGIFSKVKNDSLIVLGDGEDLNIQFDFDKENADVSISNVSFAKTSNAEAQKIIFEPNENYNQFNLKHTHDDTVKVYKITGKPYLLYEGRKSYFNWIKKDDRYFLNVDLDDYKDLNTVIPARVEHKMEDTPVIVYNKYPITGFAIYYEEEHGYYYYETTRFQSNPEPMNFPVVDYVKGLYTYNYSSYNIGFKGFFLKDDGLYSLFESTSPLTLVTTKPKLFNYKYKGYYYSLEKLKSERYKKINDEYTYKIISDYWKYIKEYPIDDYVWNQKSYTDPILETLQEKAREEKNVSSKVHYEKLDKPLYVKIGEEGKFQQYFLPVTDGSYELCDLNSSEVYNKTVFTPDKAITADEQAGFIIVNYLHNNKQYSKKIPVKVEVRKCNINCSEN